VKIKLPDATMVEFNIYPTLKKICEKRLTKTRRQKIEAQLKGKEFFLTPENDYQAVVKALLQEIVATLD
jgi:hypothetical protein